MEPTHHNLEDAWRHMRWGVEPGRFVLGGFTGAPTAADFALLGEGPGQITREGGETSLLLSADSLPALRAAHPEIAIEGPLVWVRFEAPMGWEVVGFLARVTTALAAAGIPLGAVCGFSRDHLFVSEVHLDGTRAVLGELFPGRELAVAPQDQESDSNPTP